MCGLFLLGIVSRRANSPAAAAGVVTGVLVILWMSFPKLVDYLLSQPPGSRAGQVGAWFQRLGTGWLSPFHAFMVPVVGTMAILLVGLLVARLSGAGRQTGGRFQRCLRRDRRKQRRGPWFAPAAHSRRFRPACRAISPNPRCSGIRLDTRRRTATIRPAVDLNGSPTPVTARTDRGRRSKAVLGIEIPLVPVAGGSRAERNRSAFSGGKPEDRANPQDRKSPAPIGMEATRHAGSSQRGTICASAGGIARGSRPRVWGNRLRRRPVRFSPG